MNTHSQEFRVANGSSGRTGKDSCRPMDEERVHEASDLREMLAKEDNGGQWCWKPAAASAGSIGPPCGGSDRVHSFATRPRKVAGPRN